MSYELEASFASLEEDGESLVFAFAADESGAGKYVMFQFPLCAEEQDRRLGLDGLYVECDDQSGGCYLNPPKLADFNNFSDSLPCAAFGLACAVSRDFHDVDRSVQRSSQARSVAVFRPSG